MTKLKIKTNDNGTIININGRSIARRICKCDVFDDMKAFFNKFILNKLKNELS